jgi:hypothetical protein
MASTLRGVFELWTANDLLHKLHHDLDALRRGPTSTILRRAVRAVACGRRCWRSRTSEKTDNPTAGMGVRARRGGLSDVARQSPAQGSLSKKRYRAAIRPSRAMMKSVPAYAGASPGRPDTHWIRPALPNSSGSAIG